MERSKRSFVPVHKSVTRQCKPKRIALSVVVVICFALQSLAQQPAASLAFHDESFFSKSLARTMHYRVLLPADYERSTRRYPVLYLLHGLYGDYTNWTKLTQLAQYARSANLIVVMPDAGNSWYVNSATSSQDRFEDYIGTDLMAEIEARFHTIPRREGRAIAGLSMGGYGAIKFALKNPAMFVFAGSMSGALNAPRELDRTRPEFRGGLMKVFGPAGSPTRTLNDIFLMVAKLATPQAPAKSHSSAKHAGNKTGGMAASRVAVSSLPYFYFDCGAEDSFLETNREFTAMIHEHNLPYEYHEVPGSHAWTYWNARVYFLLQVAQEKLGASE